MTIKNAFLLSALFALPIIGFSQSARYDSLVWSDEFNYNIGGGVDPNRWFHQTQLPNGSSWYNGEIQHYTNQDTNSNVKNGKLFLRAVKENYTNQGVTKNYTSARLNSKFAFKYGRVEVKAKIPTGAGTWPAIWMLGKNITEPGAYWQTQGFGTTPWPDCGEIDIMEHWGSNVNHVSSALHTPSSFGATQNYHGVYLPTATSSFHTYTMEWNEDSISFFIDNNRHYTYSPSTKNASTWPFDDEQFILLNFAVLPSISSAFTQAAMEIDYVRVYQESSATNPSNAQVTFAVDLNQYSNSFTTAYVNGDFNNWCGTCNPLSDSDNDGIWTTTLPISQGAIEYKYSLDGWNTSENFSPGGSCTNTSGSFTNRYLQVLSDTVLNPVCWESCIECPPLHTVTFAVNATNITVGPNGLYAGGGILGNARAVKLEDPDGDDIYTGSAVLNGNSQGKFIFLNSPANDTDWGAKEDLTGKPCADPNNWNDRTLPIFNSDTTLLFCYETCVTDGTCPGQQGPDNITFSVDMNAYTGSFNTVYINGDFNGWCGSCNPLTDSDGDGIWTVTLPFNQGSIEYLFTLDGWTHQESFSVGSPCTFTTGPYTNRYLAINGSTVLPTVCWNSCSACIATPPPSNNYTVTFKVNTANITVGPNGMYAGGGILGGANAVPLNDTDNDGIWEGSVLLNGTSGGNFVFFNSPSHATDWGTKEILSGLPCADPSNYDDRIIPTFSQDTTLLYCFETCITDGTCPSITGTRNVTFAINMNQYAGSTANGVYINGDFNSWCGNCNPMNDPDGDGIWTVSLPLTADSIEYKFTVDGWNDQESLTLGASCTKTAGIYTNRFVAISGDTTLATVCWNSCNDCILVPPTPQADPNIDSLFRNSFSVFELQRLPNGMYRDSRLFTGVDYHPISIANTGMGLIALCIADSMGWINNAEQLALTTLKSVTGNTPGFTPDRTSNGYFRHFMDVNTGAQAWNSEYSTIDTDILVSGALFCMKYFKSNIITQYVMDLWNSIDFDAAIANPTSGEIYLAMNANGTGVSNALTSPYNEYMITAWLSKNSSTDPNSPGNVLWNNHYQSASTLPFVSYSGNDVLTDNGTSFLSSFTHQFNYFLCHHFTTSSDYLSFFENAQKADKSSSLSLGGNPYEWGLGAGSAVSSSYHADAINNNIDEIISPHIIAGFLPIYPTGKTDLINLWQNNLGKYSLPSPSGQPILWRYSLAHPTWVPNEIIGVDYASMLFGLATLPEYLGTTFFADHNNYFPLNAVQLANACIKCDSLNVGDFFLVDGDSIEVVDRTRLLAIVAAQGDLTKVCVSHVTDMKNILRGATWFNQDISRWDVSNVTNMNSMFFKNRKFNQDISAWDVSSVTNMLGMFSRCDSFNQNLNTWDVSSVTNMNRMFKEAVSFNGAIAQWNVENVTRMTEMFSSATAFNQDLSDWCVRAFQYQPPVNFALNSALVADHYPRWGNCPQDFDNVTSLATGAFINSAGCVDCSALNIGDYFELGGDTLLVVDRAMLDSLVLLHDDLSKVCVSNITDMKDALRGLRWFNTDIAYWDVSNVTDMSNMFFKAQIFNQDIGNWDVSNVTKMVSMFQVAKVFDQDIGSWDVSNVQRFRAMFRNASAFNQNIGGWDVSNVLNDVQMSSMFRGCASFNQDLSNWCVTNAATKPSGFDANSALVAANLPLWGTCPTPGSRIGNDHPIASDEARDDAAEQVPFNEVALFPNPTTGIVQIDPVPEGSYKIFDAMGKTLEQGTIKTYYNFSEQPNGVYTLMLQTSNTTQYIKVVKQ